MSILSKTEKVVFSSKGKRVPQRGKAEALSTSVLFICFRQNGLKVFVCCVYATPAFSLFLSFPFSFCRTLLSASGLFAAIEYIERRTFYVTERASG